MRRSTYVLGLRTYIDFWPAYTDSPVVTSDWFMRHSNYFSMLKWPQYSPDIYPKENFCGVSGSKIQVLEVSPINLEELQEAITKKWTKNSKGYVRKIVESIPKMFFFLLD